ncbi:MAG: rhodanese-like domain-containing protein, partial [Proteobacteria bacterium]|nr:rhodanese-like domain-containing protein [Pseudomonadota bacterium]
VAQRFGVRTIDKKQLQAFQAGKERTVYLLDVRSPDEFIAGHLPGSVSAPGGQLVQSTDAYLGVRRSIAVLIDDNAVRATTTAAWLLQMGWQDVYVMNGALEGVTLERGPAPVAVYGLDGAKPATRVAGRAFTAARGSRGNTRQRLAGFHRTRRAAGPPYGDGCGKTDIQTSQSSARRDGRVACRGICDGKRLYASHRPCR